MAIATLANADIPAMTEENGYIEPFQMFDNVYYIGDKWVSSYAISTSTGLVIIDSLDFPYSQWIPINLEKLGLADKNIRHIFITHGHSDHVGGAQYLQSTYGADVFMSEQAFELTQAQAAKSKKESKFSSPKIKSFLTDNSQLLVGNTKFTFYLTPGHTLGDISVDFMVKDGKAEHRAFIVGGHSVNTEQPGLAQAYLDSMTRIKEIAATPPVVSVNLANHPHKNNLFANRNKLTEEVAQNPFISSENFFRFIEQQKKLAIEKIKEENGQPNSEQ
jgi:metallo-beta-lactamase class B